MKPANLRFKVIQDTSSLYMEEKKNPAERSPQSELLIRLSPNNSDEITAD